MSQEKSRWSSTEALLTILCAALLLACAGLLTISWLTLVPNKNGQPGENSDVFSGRLVITEGAVFTEQLKNKTSLQFKSLAFDVEHLVSVAYDRSSLNYDFKACEVLAFSNGSVVVSFGLRFHQKVDIDEVVQLLAAGLQNAGEGASGGLVIDSNSIQITVADDPTTAMPTVTSWPTTQMTSTLSGNCPPYQMACGDGSTCVPKAQFCDGSNNCLDGSDENTTLCATKCDGQFLLLGPTGFFHSENFPHPYSNDLLCRWIIKVQQGRAIKIDFLSFQTEEDIDALRLYEGIGQMKKLTYTLSGSFSGTVWLFSDKATLEFNSDDIGNLQGFNASYSAENLRNLSNAEKIFCSFEDNLCFWRQNPEDYGDFIRTNGPTLPPLTGPTFDHTFGNLSGYYIVTPPSPGQWEKTFQIHSLPLSPSNESMCLSFWYHMFGEDVHRLRVLVVERPSYDPVVTVVFQKDQNFGDNWNYGQANLNNTDEATVVFEAQKRSGMRNDIALDDIAMTNGPCKEGPPEPTAVPTPTTPPPVPPDCGGPFDLWEPNSTFSSPNYPHSYGEKSNCLWTLNAREGWNIQLHFLDFDVEATYDMVEVRDGKDPDSELLGVFTGSDAPFPDLISSTNWITVWFYSDASGYGRGFKANFTSGFMLGTPKPCASGQYQCQTGECIPNSSQCNGLIDCPDASDEADCVHLASVNASRIKLLQLQVQSSLYTACAQHWDAKLSLFMCSYLGYRGGNAFFEPVTAEDSPFATVGLTANGTLEVTASEKCVGERVISLRCDNQPCGVRLVSKESGDSGLMEGSRTETEDSDGSSSRVVGGTDAQKGAWPWVVSLQWRGRHVCGASLIDKEWLVTAAHCVFGKNIHLSYWEAVLGLQSQSNIDSPDTQTKRIDKIVINKHYNRRTKNADIAVMHLQTPVNFTDYVQPICLPHIDQLFLGGRKCFIAGWGKDAEQGSPVNILQQAELPLVSRPECEKLLPEYNITANMVCAGYPGGGVDSCQGDSGGPLMCEDNGHWVLGGATSFGVGCGRPQRPGVYALVPQFIDWIANVLRST